MSKSISTSCLVLAIVSGLAIILQIYRNKYKREEDKQEECQGFTLFTCIYNSISIIGEVQQTVNQTLSRLTAMSRTTSQTVLSWRSLNKQK